MYIHSVMIQVVRVEAAEGEESAAGVADVAGDAVDEVDEDEAGVEVGLDVEVGQKDHQGEDREAHQLVVRAHKRLDAEVHQRKEAGYPVACYRARASASQFLGSYPDDSASN